MCIFRDFFGNPEKRRKCAFFGIPKKSGSEGEGVNVHFSGFSIIPINVHNVRFSTFFLEIPKNDVNVLFLGIGKKSGSGAGMHETPSEPFLASKH